MGASGGAVVADLVMSIDCLAVLTGRFGEEENAWDGLSIMLGINASTIAKFLDSFISISQLKIRGGRKCRLGCSFILV